MCLWYLRNLTVLHLTGNGMTGEIIERLPPFSPITDLSLSHNQFSGMVPKGVHTVPTVDLSFNQFSGKYEGSLLLWTNSHVNFEINRLSGQLPVSELTNVSELNILNGNMFSCNTIPGNDENADDYMCGSEDLNDSLYVFGSTLLIICCIMLVVCLTILSSKFNSTREMCSSSSVKANIAQLSLYLTFQYVDPLHGQQEKGNCSNLSRIGAFSEKFKKTARLFVQLSFVMLVVIAPIYIIKNSDADNIYTTHSNTYAWFWTHAYTHGVVPSGLIMMSWIIMITVCFYYMILASSIDATSPSSAEAALSPPPGSNAPPADQTKDMNPSSIKTFGWMIVSLIANLVITTVVNALYIYSTQLHLPEYIHFGVQFGLAVFRMVYAYCVFPFLTRPITDPIANTSFRLRLLTLNNLIIPCLATAFTSPACFQVTNVL